MGLSRLPPVRGVSDLLCGAAGEISANTSPLPQLRSPSFPSMCDGPAPLLLHDPRSPQISIPFCWGGGAWGFSDAGQGEIRTRGSKTSRWGHSDGCKIPHLALQESNLMYVPASKPED